MKTVNVYWECKSLVFLDLFELSIRLSSNTNTCFKTDKRLNGALQRCEAD